MVRLQTVSTKMGCIRRRARTTPEPAEKVHCPQKWDAPHGSATELIACRDSGRICLDLHLCIGCCFEPAADRPIRSGTQPDVRRCGSLMQRMDTSDNGLILRFGRLRGSACLRLEPVFVPLGAVGVIPPRHAPGVGGIDQALLQPRASAGTCSRPARCPRPRDVPAACSRIGRNRAVLIQVQFALAALLKV